MNRTGGISDKIRTVLRIDRTLRFVWTNVPGLTIISLFIVAALAFMPLVNLYLIKLIIDQVALTIASPGGFTEFRGIAFLIFLAGLTALITSGLQQLSVYVRDAQSLKISQKVFSGLHEKSMNVDQSYYEQADYFDTLHRAQQEGPYRPAKIVNGITLVCRNALSLIAVAGLLFTFHWSIPLLICGCVLPGIVVRLKFSSVFYIWQKSKTSMVREAEYLNWLLTGRAYSKEIRLFNTGRYFSDRFKRIKEILTDEQLAIGWKRSIAGFFSEAISVTAIFAAFGYIVYKTVNGNITMGDMVMFYQAFQKGLLFFKEMLAGLADIYEDSLFISNYYEFMDIEETITSPENPEVVPLLSESVLSFDDVSFAYRQSQETVLNHLSFQINPGEIVAFVGGNGAGKTTLVKLLCRLYDPDSGCVKINGIDIRQFNPEDLRKSMGIVFQDYARYNFSAGENIYLGDAAGYYDKEKIETAAGMSGADKFIAKLPKSYATILGTLFKDGQEISAGQWQKIAIARAFYRNSGLLIFDEPASSLDVQSEYDIFKQIKSLLNGKSAVLISHRYSTIKMADRIYVLDGGKITEEGSHQKLLNNRGGYYQWFLKQADNFS